MDAPEPGCSTMRTRGHNPASRQAEVKVWAVVGLVAAGVIAALMTAAAEAVDTALGEVPPTDTDDELS